MIKNKSTKELIDDLFYFDNELDRIYDERSWWGIVFGNIGNIRKQVALRKKELKRRNVNLDIYDFQFI